MFNYRLSFNPAVIQKLEGSDQLVAGIAHALEEAIHDVRDPLAEKYVRTSATFIYSMNEPLPQLQIYFKTIFLCNYCKISQICCSGYH